MDVVAVLIVIVLLEGVMLRANPMNTCHLQSQCLQIEFIDEEEICLRFVNNAHCQKTDECLSWSCIHNKSYSDFCPDETELCVPVDCNLPIDQQSATFLVQDSDTSNSDNICGTLDNVHNILPIYGSSEYVISAECSASNSSICKKNRCGTADNVCRTSCVWSINYSKQCIASQYKYNGEILMHSNDRRVDYEINISFAHWIVIICIAFVLGVTIGVAAIAICTLWQNRSNMEKPTETTLPDTPGQNVSSMYIHKTPGERIQSMDSVDITSKQKESSISSLSE